MYGGAVLGLCIVVRAYNRHYNNFEFVFNYLNGIIVFELYKQVIQIFTQFSKIIVQNEFTTVEKQCPSNMAPEPRKHGGNMYQSKSCRRNRQQLYIRAFESPKSFPIRSNTIATGHRSS